MVFHGSIPYSLIELCFFTCVLLPQFFVVVLKPSSVKKYMLSIIKLVMFTNLMWVL